jgi:hypothetical protein
MLLLLLRVAWLCVGAYLFRGPQVAFTVAAAIAAIVFIYDDYDLNVSPQAFSSRYVAHPAWQADHPYPLPLD